MADSSGHSILKFSRWAAAASAFLFACALIPRLYEALPQSGGNSMKLIGGFVGLILLSLLLAGKDFFLLIARPVIYFCESFVFPRFHDAKPVVNYKLPEYYVEENRFEEAMAEYQKIIQNHPLEAKAYIGAFELAVTELHDDELAKKIYLKARRKLRKRPEDLLWLEARWTRLANEWIITL